MLMKEVPFPKPAIEALRGSARPGRGHASDATRIGTRTKRGSRGLETTVGRHRLGPEHVQISTPQAWSHPNTMRASGARALGGMFCNARATHTAKLCPKNTGAKTQKCWDKKNCAGSAGAKKVYAGHASHTLAHCFQEMSACMIADI